MISLVCIPTLWLLARAHDFRDLGVGSTSILVVSFVVSLCAYTALARAQFDSMIALSLARPLIALRSLAIGVAGMSVTAAAMFHFHVDFVGPASLLVGTVTFAVAASFGSGRFFRRFVFYYESAM